MDLAKLSAAVERALRVRGVVMLQTTVSQREWCSIHSAVDGHLEIHVGEPSRRLLRRRGDERWLQDNGFVHVVHAWARPLGRGYEPSAVAELLATALVQGLGADPGSSLEHVLEFPGVLSAGDVPAPTAPHVDHIAHALRAIATTPSGKACIGGGCPEEAWVWVFTAQADLLIEVQRHDDVDETTWTTPRDEASVERAAKKLTADLHGPRKRPATAPLFISLMDG